MRDSEPLVISLETPEWDVAECDRLTDVLRPAYDHPDIILDLSAVTYMDSTCLGRLAAMRVQRGKRGYASARLVIASKRIRHLFEIVHFDRIWAIYETLDEALTASAREAADEELASM